MTTNTEKIKKALDDNWLLNWLSPRVVTGVLLIIIISLLTFFGTKLITDVDEMKIDIAVIKAVLKTEGHIVETCYAPTTESEYE